MKIIDTEISEVKVLEPTVHGDSRGYFFECFREDLFNDGVEKTNFIQDNESRSAYGVIRGLHYQQGEYAQAKLIRVVSGKIIDVAVDMRKSSPTFGKYVAVELDSENKRQLFVPRGFAHGFSVLSDSAVINYKCDNYYNQQSERGVLYNDSFLNIDWKIPEDKAILSEKDLGYPMFDNAEYFK